MIKCVKCFVIKNDKKKWVYLSRKNGDVKTSRNRKDASLFYSQEKCDAILEGTELKKTDGCVEVVDEVERFA